jgi:hypothetical protein
VAALLSSTACSSASDALEAQDLINTMTDCFPDVNDKLQSLLDLAETFRTMGDPGADPVELTWSEDTADGSVDVTYDVDNLGECIFTARIVFYSPVGVAQDLDLDPLGTLSQAMDDAATQLATLFPPDPTSFMVADWTLVILGVTSGSGSGSLTGIIRGNSDPQLNELESILTSTDNASVSGGPPAAADSSIVNGSCQLTFNADLLTDTTPNQQFPSGTINFTLVGEETVTGSIDFDGSSIATITVDGVPGDFSLDLGTGDLTYNP